MVDSGEHSSLASSAKVTRTLPACWYYDDAVYRREKANIFTQAWWPIGPASLFDQTGAYRAENLFGYRIFVVRDEHGELRGFHNVCRHRASTLLEDGEGHCTQIRCPYHGWLYGFDGTLKKAAAFDRDDSLDADDHALFSVRVEVWRGLVFVCLSKSSPALLSWLGSVDTLCSDFPGPADLGFFKKFEVTGNANWKTYCDNTVEGYHLNLVHPRLARALSKGDVGIKSYDHGQVVAFHVNYGSQSEGAELRGVDGVWVYRFPGFQLTASANVFKAERIEPVTPIKLRSSNWLWYQGIDDVQVNDACDWSEQVVHEDLGMCEKVQSNLLAGVYQDGPLSPLQETHVARFQALIRDALEP